MAYDFPYVAIGSGPTHVTILQEEPIGIEFTQGVRFYLLAAGYAPAVARLRRDTIGSTSSYEDVQETIKFVIRGRTRDDALDALNKVLVLVDRARLWNMGEKVYPVWAEAKFGLRAYKSLITDLSLDTPTVALDAAFYENLKAFVIGPIELTYTRRGQWSSVAVQTLEWGPNNLGDGIAKASFEFDLAAGEHGSVDVEIDGFEVVRDDTDPGHWSWIRVDDGYLIVSRQNGIHVYEAEDLHVPGVTPGFFVETEVDPAQSIYSGQAYARLSYDWSASGAPARLSVTTVTGHLRGVERLGLFAMTAFSDDEDNDSIRHQIRAYGVSNKRKVTTDWQIPDYSTVTDPEDPPGTWMPTLLYNGARPLFLGVLSSLGGFDEFGIEVKAPYMGTSPDFLGLIVDYLVAVDFDSLYGRAIWVDGQGARGQEGDWSPAYNYKLVFNTGATTLREPQTYIERSEAAEPEVLSTLRSELTRLPSTEEEDNILAYKIPMGNSFLEAGNGLDILWMGRGMQSSIHHHTVPVHGDYLLHEAVTLTYRVHRRAQRLVAL